MPRFPKPAEGSWTEHYPELGTGPVSYEDSISPEFYKREQAAIFKRAWLNVGRVEQLPRAGSYFTKDIRAAHAAILVVRATGGTIRAFHNICRHRGNKLAWTDDPKQDTHGVCRQFTCKYHGWRYNLDGALTFVQQEGEFFNLDKERYGLVPVHCEVWAGFIFVNFAPEPEQPLREFLGPMVTDLEGYPFEKQTARFGYSTTINANWKLYVDAFAEFYHAPRPACEAVAGEVLGGRPAGRVRGAALPDRRAAPAGEHLRRPLLGDGRRAGQANGDPDPQRPVRPLGRDRPRGDAARRQPGPMRPVGAGLVPAFPELRDPHLEPGLVPDLPLLAHLLQRPRLRGQRVLPPRQERPGAHRPGDGGGDVQGVRPAGLKHPGGHADDARDPVRRSLSPQRPGDLVPAPPPSRPRLGQHLRGGPGVSGLPAEFADLEPFAGRWCLPTEQERYSTRLASTMEDMQAFYDAVVPRAVDCMAYLEALPFDALPEDATNLLHLLYSMIQVSFPVEVWRQPRIPDTGSSAFDSFTEPVP